MSLVFTNNSSHYNVKKQDRSIRLYLFLKKHGNIECTHLTRYGEIIAHTEFHLLCHFMRAFWMFDQDCNRQAADLDRMIPSSVCRNFSCGNNFCKKTDIDILNYYYNKSTIYENI
jgi:hypothetical protein